MGFFLISYAFLFSKNFFKPVIYGRMEKIMKNFNAKAKIIIALIGISTSGKTTLIGSLSKEAKAFKLLTENGTKGRSKINSEYEFLFDSPETPDNDYNTIKVSRIEFKSIPRISAGNGQPSVPDSNILELKKSILTTFATGFTDDSLANVQIFDIGKSFDVETIRKIINSTDYDRCIQRITFSLTPTDTFRKMIDSEKTGCLVLRDTQGLLDFNIDEKTNRIENIKPLSDMGLDAIDGALLFDSEMPVITEKLYQESVRDVLQAVPLFLVKNKNDSLQMLVETLQSNLEIDLFEAYNMACKKVKCKNAVDFLDRCNVVPNVFIDEKEYQKFSLNSFEDAREYDFFQQIASYIISTVTAKILNIYVEMDNELNTYNSDAHKELIFKLKENKDNLLKDIGYFDENNAKATKFFCPNIRDIDASSLYDFLEFGSNKNIAGTRGGITTRSRGRMCFPNTAVLGVAGFRFMNYAVSEMENPKNKQIMHTKLYHCIDNYATINGWYHFIDRNMLFDVIETVRKGVIIDSYDRILLFFGHLATAFCNKKVDPFKAYEDIKNKK